MKVLITGNTGFIGAKLSDYLSHKKVNVIGLSRSENSNQQLQFDLLNCDDRSIYQLTRKKELKGIDSVIHTASILAEKDNVQNLSLLKNNLRITENTISLIKQIRPKNFIHLSSIAVYPNKSGVYSEESTTFMANNTECLYGLSKFMSENLFDFYLSKLKIKVLNLRLAQTYGEGMRSDRIFSIMRKELKETNKITVWGNGKRTSNFIHIEKLLEILWFFIQDNKYSGVFNVGDENLSYKNLAQMIISEFGDDISKINFLRKGSRAHFELDLRKLNLVFINESQIK